MARFTLDQLPPAYLSRPSVRESMESQLMKQALPQFGGEAALKQVKRIRQDGRGVNKLEAAALEQVKSWMPDFKCEHHKLTLLLANGLRFTPDICCRNMARDMFKLVFYEVKGPYAREDSLIKIKVAAHEFPDFAFWLLWRDGRTGPWHTQQVLP